MKSKRKRGGKQKNQEKKGRHERKRIDRS